MANESRPTNDTLPFPASNDAAAGLCDDHIGNRVQAGLVLPNPLLYTKFATRHSVCPGFPDPFAFSTCALGATPLPSPPRVSTGMRKEKGPVRRSQSDVAGVALPIFPSYHGRAEGDCCAESGQVADFFPPRPLPDPQISTSTSKTVPAVGRLAFRSQPFSDGGSNIAKYCSQQALRRQPPSAR